MKQFETIKNRYCAAPKPRGRLETLAVVRIFFIFYFTKQYDTQRKRERNMTPLFLFLYEEHTKNTKQETVKKKRKRKKMRNRKLLRKTQATQIMKDRYR